MSPEEALRRGEGLAPLARACRLHATLGHAEACPEAGCAFWEPGGAVVAGRCAFEQLDVCDRPELAALLLDVRATLESECTREEEQEARSRYNRLLNQSVDD